MLKFLVLPIIRYYIQRYLMLKIMTHYNLISILYITGKTLNHGFNLQKFKYLYFTTIYTNVSITSDYVSPNFYVIDNVNHLKDL